MKILVLSPDLPYPPSWGFGMRVHQLIRYLAEDHSVTLLAYGGPGEDEAVRELSAYCEVRVVARPVTAGSGKRVRQLASMFSRLPFHGRELVDDRMQAALEDCLRTGGYDFVQVESSQLAGLRFPAGGPPVVLDEHNIESELLRRMQAGEHSLGRRLYARIEAAKYERLEQQVWSSVAACVVTSDRERELIAARSEVLTATVPNGVDPDRFAPMGEPVVPDSLVFNGLLSYRPNLDAAMFLVDEVLPRIRAERPGVTLTLVGHGTPQELAGLRRPGVEVTGKVPDVRPYLDRAAVVVVPIRIGGGTRLKVVEALSMARPVVSTSVGCEGIDVVDGEHLLVADDAARFAERTCTLLADPALGERLAGNGRRLAAADYSWSRAGTLLAGLYETLSRPPAADLSDSRAVQ